MPRVAAHTAVDPRSRTHGGPPGTTSISCQERMPVPKSFPTASLAATRAAMDGTGSALPRQ